MKTPLMFLIYSSISVAMTIEAAKFPPEVRDRLRAGADLYRRHAVMIQDGLRA